MISSPHFEAPEGVRLQNEEKRSWPIVLVAIPNFITDITWYG
jgi:hypothetical protein